MRDCFVGCLDFVTFEQMDFFGSRRQAGGGPAKVCLTFCHCRVHVVPAVGCSTLSGEVATWLCVLDSSGDVVVP